MTAPGPSPGVLAAYPPAVATARWTPLGSGGGFSGARVWHGRTAAGGKLCLKAHAPGADAGRLEHVVHRWMLAARAAGLGFVPGVESTRDGRTVVEAGGRVWDVTEWMPGRADFHANPTDARLFAAVEAVARLHEAWSQLFAAAPVPGPAVDAPLAGLKRVGPAGRRRLATTPDAGRPGRAARRGRLGPVARTRRPGSGRPASLVARARTGAALPVRRVARPRPVRQGPGHRTDRLRGGQGGPRRRRSGPPAREPDPRRAGPDGGWRSGLSGRPPIAHPELVAVLDWTGVVVGVTNWLRWLYHDGRAYPDRSAVAGRVGELVGRLP